MRISGMLIFLGLLQACAVPNNGTKTDEGGRYFQIADRDLIVEVVR